MGYKPTVCFDFDGVIHKYDSKWTKAEEILDGPVEGIKEAIEEIRKEYKVVVASARCSTEEGLLAVYKYLNEHGIEVDDVCHGKPIAIVYIDDRGITFDGDPSKLLGLIKSFKPWNKK